MTDNGIIMKENMMTKNYNSVIRVYLVWFSQFIEGRSFQAASAEACAPHNLEQARTKFMQEGFDGAEVTTQLLEQAAFACGWHPECFRPLRTFKDMLEVLEQHRQGLVTDGELLLAVQLVPNQVRVVVDYNRLPYKVQAKCRLSEWDGQVASSFGKNL